MAGTSGLLLIGTCIDSQVTVEENVSAELGSCEGIGVGGMDGASGSDRGEDVR